MLSFEKNAYSEHDLNILRALAVYTAIDIDNADAFRRLNGTLDFELTDGHVAKHGKRADSIVKSMMEHASGGHGERFPVDVNAFIDEYVTLAYHGRRAQSPGIELYVERDFQESLGIAEMAPQELGRVIVNLLNNAFDAVTEKRGRVDGEFHPTVTIRTRLHGEHVRITVEDNGPGIPETVRAHIFEPFFTTKPTGSGTGLGLSLSYDIMTQGHGGHLDVESADGRGAAFVISLPINSKTTIETDAATAV